MAGLGEEQEADEGRGEDGTFWWALSRSAMSYGILFSVCCCLLAKGMVDGEGDER